MYKKGSKRCKDYNTEECQLWCERLKAGKCPYDHRNRKGEKE